MILATIGNTEISIFSEEEMIACGYKLLEQFNLRICKGYYLNPRTTLAKIIEAVGLEKEGVFDYAVPEDWARANKYPKAIWFYPKEGENHLFGKPVYHSTLLDKLKSLILNQAMLLWEKEVNKDE